MKPWGRPETSIRPAEVADCDVLSEIHSAAFRRGWSEAEFEAFLVQPRVQALIALYRPGLGRQVVAGFIIYRMAANEAEVLSVAVRPNCRRRGIGRMLLEDALRRLYREGAKTIHLEVEDANAAAIGLYRRMEFQESGKRAGYYAQGRERPASALVMARQLR